VAKVRRLPAFDVFLARIQEEWRAVDLVDDDREGFGVAPGGVPLSVARTLKV